MDSKPNPQPSELAKYQDLFLRLLDSSLLLHAETFAVLEVNDACERLLKAPTDRIIGVSLLNWVDDSEKESFEKAIRIARRRYYPREWDAHCKTADGQPFIAHVSACPVLLSDGTQVIQILLRDVTQEREAEQKITNYVKELEILNQRLEELSNTDEMTKLFNFRHFKTHLAREHERSNRYKRPYAIIFFDADNFKHYNDRNGHPAGDELLRQLAKLIKANCRASDLPARYGGEEFAILCPETDAAGAYRIAERLRETIEKHPFAFAEFQPLGRVSVSVGVAAFPDDGLTLEQVLESADQGVYHSKHSGRNRVTAYGTIRDLPKKAKTKSAA